MAKKIHQITSKALQERMGISRQLAHVWMKQGVPLARVPEVSEALGLPKHKIRPDYWPAPKRRDAQPNQAA